MVTFSQSKPRKTSRVADERSRLSPDPPVNTSLSEKVTRKEGKTPRSVGESKSQADSVQAKEARLAELLDEIRSKERTLGLLDEALPSDANSKQLLGQLQLRDQRIEELNTRIQGVEAQLAAVALENYFSKDRQISQLQEDKAKMMREIQGLEEHNGSLDLQMNNLQKELTEVRENSELLQEGLSEESEQLRTSVAHKDEVVKSAKADIMQLSKIVGEMSKLNTELNEKILAQNTEIEKLNASQYQLNVKAIHSDEIETAYNELRAELQKSQNKNLKLNEENSRLRVLEDTSRICQEQLKSAEEGIQAGSFEANKLMEVIQQVRYGLKANTTVQKSVPDDPSLLKQEIGDLKSQIKELNMESRKKTAAEAVNLERIQFLEGEKVLVKQHLEEAIERLQKRINLLQDNHDKAKFKADRLETDVARTDADLQKANTQVLSLQSQVNLLKMNRKEVAGVETKLQATIRDLKAQINILKSQKASQESSITAREQRLKQTATKLKVLTDEAWKRDTEIMKCKKAITKLQDEITKLKSSEQTTHAKAKTKIAEEMTNVNVQLEEKDREITILREMIRSMQQQLKTKDIEASRMKRKVDGDPVREVGSPVSSPEPGMKKLAARIDSELKAIESLLSLRTKLGGEGKIPTGAVKKILELDTVPKDKGQIITEVNKRLNEAKENLVRFATSKQSFSLATNHFGGNPQSETIVELMQNQDSVSIAAIIEKVNSIS